MGNRSKILVIDEDVRSLRAVRAGLPAEHYEVVGNLPGEEPLAALARTRPDCALMGLRGSASHVFALCERARALPGGCHMPIILLAEAHEVTRDEAAFRRGGVDFLFKPLRTVELFVRIEVRLKLRRMERDLRASLSQLQRHRDELSRVQEQQRRLTSFVVHDLKNPINAIDLSAQLIARQGEISAQVRESTQVIRRESRHMLRLVLNLLDINRAEEGLLQPVLAETDFIALTQEVLDEVQPQARARGVRLEAEVDPAGSRLFVDRDLLTRVLENLVDNGIKHAPSGSGCVRVQLGATDDGAEIRVIDDGEGIPSEMREKIFDKYVQCEASHPGLSRAGRGLGLTFCKWAVEAHHGSIWVEDLHPGTAFCVRVPGAA